MNKPLKILHLEDLPEDAEMVARALRKAGIAGEIKLVENNEDFIQALKEFTPDIILSDHSLPSFDSHEALKIVKDMDIDIPFILITATVSEEYAVNIIKEGASDYILKDRLQRLPNAIANALEKFNLELEKKRAHETLLASERKYKLLFESNPMPMWMLSKSTLDIIAVNQAALDHYGYTRDEFLSMNGRSLRPAEDVQKYEEQTRESNGKTSRSVISRHKKKDGSIIMVDILAHDVMYENAMVSLILANDITEKLKAESELSQQRVLQQKLVTKTSIQVQEREREEIGTELHDNINQVLAAAKLYLQMAIKKEDQPSEELKRSHENIVLAIDEIRKLSHTLVAPSLGEITLIEAIKELITDIQFITPLRLELIANNYKEDALDKHMKLMFYRITQEQINNILKHAQAKKATIQLKTTPDHIVLIIKDDGVGFDSNKTPGGIGLRNITNRAEFYDGTVSIISSPGKGCTLEVSVPVRKD